MFEISIEDSIKDILKTKLGGRVMKPDYGSRLHELADKKFGDEFIATATNYVAEALKYEPRVNLKSVKAVVDDDGKVIITVVTDETTISVNL